MHFVLYFIGFFYILNLIMILTVIFRERHRPAQTWAWILVLTFLPVIGFFLYIFFGRGISNYRIFDLRGAHQVGLLDELNDQIIHLKEHDPVISNSDPDLEQLQYMTTIMGNSLYTRGNDIQLFEDGIEKFEHLIEDLKNAKDHIHMEYYIYRTDSLGKKIKKELIAASKRGVKVRILLDAWGCSHTPKRFWHDLEKAGGEVEYFFPIFIPYVNPRLNYRNHRKIVVIDGKIGYTGGFNIGREYLGIDLKFGYWKDNHLRIEGPAVYSLQNRFLMDWNSHHKFNESYKPEYFPASQSKGNMDSQIITSGPDNDIEQIKMVYLKMISLAKKEILIQTPYYIPDDALQEALKVALSSGVKVTIQIPNKPDHILVYWATYSFVSELIPFGAKVEIYNNGFLHAKTMIIDQKVVSIGSANIDVRSFRLDFEVNTLIYDKEFVMNAIKMFNYTSKDCEQLTLEKYEQRGHMIKFKEGLARLISPLL